MRGEDTSMALVTDEALCRLAAQGDQDALETLLCRHAGPIRHALHIDRKWSSVLDVDDVMQVTHLEAFLNIRQFDPERGVPFCTWLRRIAENNLRDAIRGLEAAKQLPPQRRLDRGTDDADPLADLLELAGFARETASRVLMREEAHASLTSALTQLPPVYGTVLRLYDLEQHSIEEVSAALERSPGAVHLLRVRARERLREMLGSSSQFFSGSPRNS
jgi:RNA polymerase sigma-70 factor (ECF subfamily)